MRITSRDNFCGPWITLLDNYDDANFDDGFADDALATASVMEEFRQLLENYAKRHRDKARPLTDLERLVEQVKNE